jgi:hypothetical protein
MIASSRYGALDLSEWVKYKFEIPFIGSMAKTALLETNQISFSFNLG